MSSKKTLKLNPNIIFLLVVEALFAYLAVRTFRYSRVASMMPGIIIAFILLVTSILLVRELVLFKRNASGGTVEKEETVAVDTDPTTVQSDRKAERMRELEIVAWFVGLIIMIYLLGFLVAIPIFMFIFLRIRFSIKWLTTAAITIGLEVGVYLIFVVWLQTMLYSGLISKLFIPQ